MKGLSLRTWQIVQHFFPPDQHVEAGRLLMEECNNSLPSCGSMDEIGMERIRFAALKLSEGKMAKLQHWVNEAKMDWRDVLMAADFGLTLTAHEEWAAKIV